MTSKLPPTYSDHVLATHEREKARNLAESLSRLDQSVTTTGDPEILKAYEKLRERIGPISTSNADQVRIFHDTSEIATPAHPTLIDDKTFDLRHALILEELGEWYRADTDGDIVEVADALADLLYVVYGTALVYGLPIDEIFAEVHRSNMTKFPGGKVLRREDGKILKPDTWEAPKIKEILDDHS